MNGQTTDPIPVAAKKSTFTTCAPFPGSWAEVSLTCLGGRSTEDNLPLCARDRASQINLRRGMPNVNGKIAGIGRPFMLARVVV